MNHRPPLRRWLLGPLLGLPLLGGCGSEADHPTPASEATHATAAPGGEARTEKGPTNGGRWRRSRPDPMPADAAPSVDPELGRLLESLGYADGSRAPSGSGVTLHDAERAFAGANFFTSAHAEVAILTDMQGRVLHEWSASFADTLGADFEPFDDKDRRWWRRAWLFENGDVLALIPGAGLLKLDARSRVLWARLLHVHHDLAFEPDGGMVVLTREVHVLPRVDPEQPVVEDRVAFLDSEGIEKRSFSLLEALEGSEYRGIWLGSSKKSGDLFHTNSIEILDGSLEKVNPAFRAGNLLVSFRVLDTIAVVDPTEERVVWALRGAFRKQHDPKVLPSGRLLLYDNVGHGDRSAILELDPATWKVAWQFVGSSETPFLSRLLGTAQALPNGNVLITESDNGRVLEIDRDGDLVWEYRSPYRAGPNGEFVATLPEMIRLAPDFPLDWLEPRER